MISLLHGKFSSNSPAHPRRIRQFDSNYQTYFYVNPTTNPPTTSWTHPSLAEGQVHPEQAQAIHEAQQTGGNNQGEAAKFLNSGSVADPATGSYNQPGQIQGADGQNPEAGERGLGSMVSGLMGKTNNNNVCIYYDGRCAELMYISAAIWLQSAAVPPAAATI